MLKKVKEKWETNKDERLKEQIEQYFIEHEAQIAIENLNKPLAKRADWLFRIMDEFPNIIKSISEPKPIHRNDVSINNTLNVGRFNLVKEKDKEKLCESFNNYGFLNTEEAMIVMKRTNLSLLSKQKLYEPPASFHRLGGILLTDKQKNPICKVDSPPCHVIEFHDNVEDEDINQILSIIAEEENAQKNVTPIKPQTPEDIEAGLLHFIKGYTVKGKPATKKQKIDYLHKELKRRVRIHKKQKKQNDVIAYPIWTSYQKARDWKKRISIKIGHSEKPISFKTFADANEFYDRTLVDDNIPTYQTHQLDDLNFQDNKLRPCISLRDDLKFINLYWPKNRHDRNIRDLLDIIHKAKDEKLNNIKVLLFLHVTPSSLAQDDEIIRTYVSQVEKDLDILDDLLVENNVQIIRVGIIPGDDRHKRNEFLDYNDYI